MTIPTREFTCVVDPDCLPFLLGPGGAGAMSLELDLSRARPPVDIHLVFPAFLAAADALPDPARIMFEVVDTPPDIPAFQPGPHLPREVKDALAEPSKTVRNGLSLLALTHAWQGDWLLRRSPPSNLSGSGSGGSRR